ncbi:MAG TPA: hypothetical protein VIL73_00170, partial [Gaiellaceae bacterium]
QTPAGGGIFQKHMVFVALTVAADAKRAKVLRKARAEQDLSINRLTSFVDDLPAVSRFAAVRTYFDRRRVYFLGHEVSEEYSPVRHDILKEIIRLHSA